LDELAERRKRQLEELRRRRSAGTTQARTTARPTAATQQRPGPVAPPPKKREKRRIQELRADYRSMREAELAERRREEQQARERRALEEARARREAEEERRRDLERQRRAQRDQAGSTGPAARHREVTATEISGSLTDAYAISEERDERTERLRGMLSARSTLRDLFILKELLDPPVSLRESRNELSS
jgi:hypothetical protein